MAIAAQAAADPIRSCSRSRQRSALYVGLGDDCFIVASEPYGVVEECDRYMRLDGEDHALRSKICRSRARWSWSNHTHAGAASTTPYGSLATMKQSSPRPT